jgi:hypothetical protein
MRRDLEWTIEHETLPADEPALAGDPVRPVPAGRRRPRWAWFLVGAALVVLASLAYLYRLGSEGTRQEEETRARLTAVVELELSALSSGDREILATIQDGGAPRQAARTLGPWLHPAGDLSGPELTLRDVAFLDAEQSAAVAQVTFPWWDGTYQMTWRYQRVGDQWVHTLREPDEAGEYLEQRTGNVTVAFRPDDRAAAAAVLFATDTLAGRLCELLTCPGGAPAITVVLDPALEGYWAERSGLFLYRLPAPGRIRWPTDGRPEPLVMASLGRHVAFDLFARLTMANLEPASQEALPLALAWAVHHLLEAETPPGTHWLDSAAADGRQAAVAYIDALRAGGDVQASLASAFEPATVDRVTSMPDYFGWLVLTYGRTQGLLPGYAPSAAWRLAPLARLDQMADPWAPAGRVYRAAGPDMLAVTYQDGWALATAAVDTEWPAAYAFEQVDGQWRPREPALAIPGEPRTIRTGRVALQYWIWDEPLAPGLLKVIARAESEAVQILQLSDVDPLTFVLVPGGDVRVDPDVVAIPSPTIGDDPHNLAAVDYQVRAALVAIASRWYEGFQLPDPGGWALSSGLSSWTAQRILDGLELDLPAWWLGPGRGEAREMGWQPPGTVDSPEWMPLADLWDAHSPVESAAPELEASLYPRLVMDYLFATYGAELLPAARRALSDATSTADWIDRLTGESLDRFEPAWRAWVIDEFASR